MRRFRGLFGRRKLDRELDDELRFHIDERTRENIEAGMAPEEARRAARLAFGNPATIKQDTHAVWTFGALERLWQDLRYAARALRKNPGFAAIAILTLALGVGVNAAIFSVVNGAVLRPLPVRHPEQLVVLACKEKDFSDPRNISYRDFLDYRRQARAFSDMLAYEVGSDALASDNRAEEAITTYVTGNYFSMLGLRPALGRLIEPGEGDTPGADPVLVLGYDYWKRRFGGGTGIIGKSLLVDGRPMTIVGVAPRNFRGTWWFADASAYLPISQMAPAGSRFWTDRSERGEGDYAVLARLKPGVSLAQAQVSLKVVAASLAREFPRTDKDTVPLIFPERLARPNPSAASSVPLIVGVFLALAAVVLLAACVNLANLLLARDGVRRRELALRSALGAGRGRMARQLMAENLLLAGAGGGLALLLSKWVSTLLVSICTPVDFPWFQVNFGIDWRVVSYACALSLLAAGSAGAIPAWKACRVDLATSLHGEGRVVAADLRRRLSQNGLVIAQVAASMLVLTAAGLLVRSLENAERIQLNFNPHHLIDFSLNVSQVRYRQAQGVQFYQDLLRRANALPGVEAATYSYAAPFGAGFQSAFLELENRPLAPGQPAPLISYNVVDDGYFSTLQMPILGGRSFTERDTAAAPLVAIVNRAMAAQFWSGEEPIGRRFRMRNDTRWISIVGIVPDSQYSEPSLRPQPCFYVPLSQHYTAAIVLQVRTPLPLHTMASEIEPEVQALAPGLPVTRVLTMEQQLNGGNGLFLFHVGADLAAGLGAIALLLSVIGVYGVISYVVSRRRREIAIRVALGAIRGNIFWMVIGRGLALAGIGTLLGLLAVFVASRPLSGMLWGLRPTDPLTLAGAAAALASAALFACYVPARRATKVDPLVALREE